MYMKKNQTIFSFALLALLGAGCFSPPSDYTPVDKAVTSPATSAAEPGKTADDGVQQDVIYGHFTQAKYENAVAEGKPIILFFYANWCPYCKTQDPINEKFFATLGKPLKVFRVNFNDTDTDADEKKLASELGISYQHTFVALDKNGKEVKRIIGTQSPEQLAALVGSISE